jgi:RND family efflux transporter MFP subunit
MSMAVRHYRLVIVVALALLVVGGLLRLRSADDEVATATVTTGSLEPQIEATGILEPANAVTVSGRVGGWLRLIAVAPGDQVVAGDIIAQLDDVPLQAAVDASRRRLEVAEFALTAAELAQTEDDPQQALAIVAATQAIADARASLAAAERDLLATRILAPVGGSVLAVAVADGQAYAPGSPIAIVAEADRLQVRAELDERDVILLSPGAPVALTADALPTIALTGRITAIAPRGERTGGIIVFPVTIALDDVTDDRLRPGMSVTVRFSPPERGEVLLVLAAAVTTVGQRSFLDVVQADVTVRREVTIGAQADGLVEITAGDLRPGDRVRIPG